MYRKKLHFTALIMVTLFSSAHISEAQSCHTYKKPVEDKIVLERFKRVETLFPPESAAWRISFPPARLPVQPFVSRYQLGTDCLDGGSTLGQVYKDKNGNEVTLGFIPMIFADRWGKTPSNVPHSQKNAIIASKPGTLTHSEDTPVKIREYTETVAGNKALLSEMDYTSTHIKHITDLYIFLDKVEIDIESDNIYDDKGRLITFASTLDFDALRKVP